MKTPSLLLLSALLPGALVAQYPSKNVQFLGRFAQSSCNDVWGYRNPTNGKEYALLGTTSGTHILDVSTPATPVQRAFISVTASPGWRNCTTRDMKVYRGYAYVVTDCGGGMQIIDIRNPDSPRLVKTWGGQFWSGAHNIAMDEQAGVLYPCGSIGVIAVDVKTDPENPRFLGRTRSFGYVHDLSIQDGFAHFCSIFARTYNIIDIRNLPTFRRVGSATDAGSIFCHASWPTRDNLFCVTTNERGNGPTGIYDIKDKTQPRLVATWHTGGSSTVPHNVIVRDRVVHLSYYIAGGRFLDLSNPSQPLEVGFIDTSTRTSGFNGAWGIYIQPQSGISYISDRQAGLIIVKAKASAAYYGRAAVGTGNRAPTIHGFGAAYAGNTNHKIELENGRPSSPAIFALSLGRGNTSLGQLPIHVDLRVIAGIFVTATDAQGKSVLPVPVPATVGSGKLYAQGFVVDANGPGGLSATQGVEIELFRR